MDLSVKHLRNLFGGNIPVAQVLQSVASGMADCGVEVVIDPNTQAPYAIPEQKKIVLPAHVRSEKALLIVSWHVDHEAGHIIYSPPYAPTLDKWLTKSKMLDVCIKQGYKKAPIKFDRRTVHSEMPESILNAAKFFHNLCEDSRIEHLMISRWPGTKKHFIGGPIAASCDNIVADTLKEAEERMEKEGLDHIPISPFFIGMFHASALLDGSHGQKDRDYVRDLAPEHVQWVLDLVDDEFSSVHILSTSFEELADKVDTVVAGILEKILPEFDENQDPNQGGGQGQGQTKGQQGKSQKSKKQSGPQAPNPFEEEIQSGGSGGDGEDGEEMDDDGSGSSKGNEDGSDEASGSGSSKGEDSEDEGEGGGAGDESSDSDDEDDADADADGEGSDESEEDGESDSTEGDGEGTDELDDGDEESEDENTDESGDETGNGDDQEESDADGDDNGAETGNVSTKSLPKQVEEWAKEAQVDTADLIRASGDTDSADEHGSTGSAGPSTSSGSPGGMNHAATTDGMPDDYLANLAPGARVVVIRDNDLSLLFSDQDQTFQAYDNFIRGLMPQNLGPAARRLLGRFKGAPGKAWTGTRINPKMLQPIVSGNAYGRRLYLRRNEPTQSKKGVCVMVAIDCSGSMCESVPGLNVNGGRNSKFSVSHAAARGIARLLQTVNVPFAVMGFMATQMKNGSRNWGASRHCDIVNFLFKDFHEPWTACEQRMLAMNPNTSVTYKGSYIAPQTNSDGESILWGATQIITREEATKIMIVISDGLPYAGNTDLQSRFLKWAVRRIEIAGIKIGGLGLGDDGVKHYYRLHELITSFPPGMGTNYTAPLYIQEKILSLIDRLTMGEE